jgi:aarF domain-containing kinase
LNSIFQLDYKLFFDEDNVEELHTRAAKRVVNVCGKNGGLYVKFGQGIAGIHVSKWG